MRQGGQKIIPATVSFRLPLLRNLAIGNVLNRQQDRFAVLIAAVEPLCVQQNCLLADLAKTMGNFVIPQSVDLGQDSPQQLTQPRDVPFAFVEIKEMPLQRILRPDPEGLVKLM